MSVLDPHSPKPLHTQLEEIIRGNIMNGDWSENSRIPSENELSREYGLSRMTVRSVILRLAQEGLLYRVPGKGTFVSVNKLMPDGLKKMVVGHSKDMDTEGVYGHEMDGDREAAAEYIQAAFDRIITPKK